MPRKKSTAKTREKRVLFSDWDGTLGRETQLTLLIQEFFVLGIFDRATQEIFLQAYLAHRDRVMAYDDFEMRQVNLFLERLEGKLVSDVEAAAIAVVKRHRNLVYTFTATLLRYVAETHERVAVTGAIEEIASILAPAYGFDTWYATQLERNGSRYTGKQLVVPPHDKKTVVEKHRRRTKAPFEGSIAIGDTGSDIPMLAQVMHPIAFNPNGALATEAEKRGWPVVLERKDNIYVNAGCVSKRFESKDAEEAVRYVLSLPASDQWHCKH